MLTSKCTLVILLLAGAIFVSAKKGPGRSCTINPEKDFNDTHVLYLHPNDTNFLYPDASDNIILTGDGPVLRIACSAGNITVRNNVTTYTSVQVECLGGCAVHVKDTYIYGPLNNIGCTSSAPPNSRITKRKATNGNQLAQIGYAISPVEFVPIIDDISVSKRGGGYIARWVHYKVPATLKENKKSGSLKLKNGRISGTLNYKDVYDRTKQKEQMLVDFKDKESVDKYLPDKGKDSFVAGHLISSDDLYYEAQRNATALFETTTPIWSSVNNGNWRLVGEIVRNMAKESQTELDVWSGSYLWLYLPNKAGKITYVHLPNDLTPPQFLFKYVYDHTNKNGVVLITVNNPFLTQATKNNVICEKMASCEKQHPEFVKFTRGYTYCCSLANFTRHAVKLGLPIFKV